MSDKQRQIDEIEVLESIYDTDLVISSRWPSSGCLRISPDPSNDEIDMTVVSTINGKSVENTTKLKYLVPIEFYFKCPVDYPSKSQPLFMLKCIWLSEKSLTALCRNFDEIWDRTRSEILYDWAYSLKDCCSFLKLEKLNFSVTVIESSIYPLELTFTKQNPDLKLKELKNKILDSKVQSESYHEENLKKKKFRRTRNNFKYETPKEKPKIQEKADSDQLTSKDDQLESVCSTETSPLTSEFILSKLPTYGIRRKTLFNDCDSRIIPNYEETKPDKHGSRGKSLVVQKMIDFNDQCISKAFRHESHLCGICFDLKQGSESVRVKLCGHIFCRECVSQYLSINIADGNLCVVDGNICALKCLNSDCSLSFTVAEIQQSVDESIFKKFTKFSLKMVVENNPNLMFCPRDVCQGIACRRPELGIEVCHCKRCSFYFCMYCKKTYHGVQPCDLLNEERLKVIKEYLNGDFNHRKELERRYTKTMVNKWVDEHLTSKYIEESSRPCPNCKAPIQKNNGCNKMLCLNCNIPFCWLCNQCLSTVNPYFHFSNVDSPCYEKLFILPDTEEPEDFFEEEPEDDLLDYDFWEDAIF